MPYMIRTYDKPNSAELRARVRADHLEYIRPYAAHILAAGGFLDDLGEASGGGIIVIDSEERSEAQQFVAADPYYLAGLFERVEIVRWRKVIFNGEFLA